MNKDIKILAYIYSVRIYTAIITIALIPSIIREIGIESYGLIGFFAVLQACLGILDAGIGGVLTRQSIISKVSKEKYSKFNELYKKVIKLFLWITLFIFIIGWYVSTQYGMAWLKTNLEESVVVSCMIAMFWIFAVRYLQGPFRSILLSNEKQLTITTINFISVTFAQPLALLLLTIFHGGVLLYFIVQFVSAILTTALFVFYGEKTRRKIVQTLPSVKEETTDAKMDFKNMIKFAVQLSTLSILWILVNQSDKLTLTSYMELSTYGAYSVAISITAILTILSDPLNQYLQPKLTKYYHNSEYTEYSKIFVNAFKFITLLTIPLGIFLFFYSKELLLVWSGDVTLSTLVSLYLPWLFIGSVFAVFSNFIFLLLYSMGILKQHTIVYAIFSAIVIPLNIIVAKEYLGEGSSILFFTTSLLLFVFWGGYNFHKYFNKGMFLLLVIILPVSLIEIVVFYSLSKITVITTTRVALFSYITVIGIIGFSVAFIYLFLIEKLKIDIYFREIKK